MNDPSNKIDDLLQNSAPGVPATQQLLCSSQASGPVPRTTENDPCAKSTAQTLGVNQDPVRIYLRELRVVPLLTREGEVEIAKRIERGQENLLKAVSRSPVAMAELLGFKERLKSGKTGIRKLVNFNEESLTPEILKVRCQKFCQHLDEIQKLHNTILKQEDHLVGGKKRTAEDKKLRWQLAQHRLSVKREVTDLDFRAEIREHLVNYD